jgi:hypothetical protein
MNLTKETKTQTGGKTDFSTNDAGKTGSLHAED